MMNNIASSASILVVIAIIAPGYDCRPGVYGTSAHSRKYEKTGSGYGSGPKSSAIDALKSLYHNQNAHNYNFGYDVKDNVYGNYQSRHESGSSDPKGVTKGSYTVVEPDGLVRTVNYEADWINGFRATVNDRNGHIQHGYNTKYGNNDGSGGDDYVKEQQKY